MPALKAISRALRFAISFFIFAAFVCPSALFAQQSFIRHYAVEDGLQGSMVKQCLQDKQGYIWIATDEGLNRFDGFEFRSYSFEEGLGDDNILDMRLESDGSILLRTPSKMYRNTDGKIEVVEGADVSKVLQESVDVPTELAELVGDEISLRNYFLDSKKGNWLCTNFDGLYRVWEEAGSIRAEHYLENKSVNGVTEDREGNYWVSTAGSGVYFIPARVYKNLNSYNGLDADDIYRLEALEDDWVLAEGPEGKLYEIDLVEGNVVPVDGDPLARDNYFKTSKGTWEYVDGALTFASEETKASAWKKAKVRGIAHNEKLDRAVIGTNIGLFICQDLENCELVNIAGGLRSNKIRSVYVTSKGNMLLATNRGVSEVYGAKIDAKYRVKNITMSDGLASNDVYDVIKAGNYLCVATNRGLTYFDEKKNKKEKRLPPVIYISAFSVADSLRNWKHEKTVIRPHENEMQIDYAAINYGSAGDIEYQYYLDGLDDHWVSTRNRSVRFSSLPPGEYTFKVRAKGKDGQLSEISETVDFKIKARLTETYTFRILATLLALGLIGALALWRIRNIRMENEMKSQMVEMEQQALRAQMNPHFIFNSLSSIQQFINTNEKRTANKYLARFAELMRRILYNSRNAHITLKDEVKTLTLYMELEALRFNEQLDYFVNVEGGEDQNDLQIPTMFIQPYVENAILHGVPPIIQNGERGKVEVNFYPKSDHVFCTVEDNGIGRERALEIKQSRQVKNESTAMKNIEQRLSLLSPGKEVADLVKVIDLKNEEGVATGTRIEIQIPYV